MRTSNSIKNSIVAVISSLFSIIIGFIAQKIFINILGAEYLGINGLFSNILSMLSIAELGIGGAIIFHLYKPIANNDIQQIKPLLQFYKKAYNYIAIAVFILGICAIPFLNFFIREATVDLNFIIVYILFLFQTVSSYILTYKRSILYANQKDYIVNGIHIVYLILLNLFQLVILYITNNYYLYLGIKIIFVLLENIVINIVSNKLYPYILDKNIKPLDKKIEKDIFRRVKAQILHKIGGVIINGSDNIIISKFFGIVVVGLCSNYLLIINAVKSLFSQFISSITASIGNLLVEDNKSKSFDVYKKIRFFDFWMSTFSSISVLVIMQNFITIWIGKEYLLAFTVLCALVFNLYQKLMRTYNDVFLSAAGICVENRFVPLIESVLNIVSSVICLKIFGLAGVFMGTIISGLALWCYSYPKFVYKKLFNRSYIDYAKETIGYILLFVFTALITYGISILVNVSNPILQIIVNCIICIIVPNLILFIIFRKSENFQYFIELLSKMLRKIKLKKGNKVEV